MTVSRRKRGSVPDITILKLSELLKPVNDSVQIIVDKRYVDDTDRATSREKPHGHEITDQEKNLNHNIISLT